MNPSLASRAITSVTEWLAKITDDGSEVIPKPSDEVSVATFVGKLWQESYFWRQSALEQRTGEFDRTLSDVSHFHEQCRKLEQGKHWEVYGRRNTAPGHEWQHELVDDEIGNQIRVRKSHLTGNWHDVLIHPNIDNINEILDQERADTRWSDVITQGVHKGLTEGTAVFVSMLDRSEDPDGKVREFVADNGSIFPTPFSTSFDRIDGCWFVIYATLEQKRFVEEQYPELKGKITDTDTQRLAQLMGSYAAKHGMISINGLVDKLVCWMDDPALEKIPFDPEEIDAEHAAFHEGRDVPVLKDQNHRDHIEAHNQWLNEVVNSVPEEERTDEDAEFIDAVTQLVLIHMEEHMAAAAKKKEIDGIPVGKRRKYPFGRRVVVVSNQVAEDAPSPHEFDWRKLFHKFDVEKLPENFWGRGDAEILWNTNKTLDTMLSRIADISLAVGTPKPWFHENDRAAIEDEEKPFSNDPLTPGFYTVNQPTFPQGSAPQEPLQIYQAMKANASKQLGVNDISYGRTPTSQASGDLAEILLRQNQVVVTGEANQRLNDVIESIVETRLLMWKQYYTEPRMFYINGKFQAVNLSKLLSVQRVKDPATGEVKEVPIPAFQIRVKPGSNLANQWEGDLTFAMQLFNMKGPDGMPLIPKEAILDLIQQRYPQFGREGDYYQLSEAMKIGLQVLSQEEAKRKDEVRTLKGVREKFKKRGIEAVMEAGGNGQPIEGAQ